jgi:tetratricopeptide (TPR) repeat protein
MQQNINKSARELVVQDADSLLKQPVSKVNLAAVLIVVVCVAVLVTHWPALSAQALSFDDNRYFVENFLVRDPGWESARRFLTEVFEPSTVGGYYQPLTMISLMLDYALGGQTDSLLPFHITSLALHIANTALIIVLLYQLFGRAWVAAGVGLLFGVHPLTVEPIPWVGERKTLLAAFFTLWSLVLYMRFVHKGSSKAYRGSIVMYVLALMSKPTSTPLPVLMLLADYWPLRRLKWRSLLEKLPFFVIGGISAVITYISQSRTASVITPESYGFMRVPLVICHNIIFYLYKIIWPVNLSSHYVFPKPLGLSTPMILVGVIGTCILIPLLVVSLRWTGAALAGWLIFFVMVFPTMQMLQFSDVIASDKFIYLPSIGILMILAAFLGWICSVGNIHRHKARCVAVAIIVLTLAGAESFATRQYLVCWQDTAGLFAQMVKVTPKAVSPLNNLGVALVEKGDIKQAMDCFNKVLKIDPNSLDAHVNMGAILAGQRRYDEALSHYNQAIRVHPSNASTYHNLGLLLIDQGRTDEAIALYRKGLEHKPPENASMLHTDLGTIFLQQGKIDEAIYELQTSVSMKPDATAINNLGVALTSKGRIDEALQYHKRAVRLEPRNAEAHYDIANILLSQDKLEQAVREYEKALSINPKYAKAHGNLAVALSQQGRPDEAIEHFTEAVKIEPNNPHAHFNLASALADKGVVGEAIGHLRKTVELAPADIDARCKLAELLLQQGHTGQAIAEYEQTLKLDPNNQDAQLGLLKARDMQKGEGQSSQPTSGGTPSNP